MDNYWINSLLYLDDNQTTEFSRSNGDIKPDRSLPHGVSVRSLMVNSASREYILEILSNDNYFLTQTITIDYRLLNDDEIMNALREKALYQGVGTVRIIGDGYSLRLDDLNRLDFTRNICVDEFDNTLYELASDDSDSNAIFVENQGAQNPILIFKQRGLYYDDTLNTFGEQESGFFINRDMSQEQINYIVNEINNNPGENKSLNIRFYNPAAYRDLLVKIGRAGLNEDVKISLLGNPLHDQNMCFSGLNNIVNNEIEIIYNTCQDMINCYCNEPFSVSNYYESELEGCGRTDLDNYTNVLATLENFENHINEKNYSPLEAMIYGYEYLNKNYIYDHDIEQTDSVDYETNRALHNVVGRDRMVCVGYATLYSAMLRRVGLPTFCYSTNEHKANIVRIHDEKYNVDKIAVCDSTNDTQIKSGPASSYSMFALPPQIILKSSKPEHINIPTSLVIDRNDLETYWTQSRSLYETHFSDFYRPDGYTYTMLQLMGYDFEDTWSGYNTMVEELNRDGSLDEINPTIISQALLNVLRGEKIITEENASILIPSINNWVDVCYNTREFLFSSDTDRINLNYPINADANAPTVNVPVRLINSNNYSNDIEDSYAQGNDYDNIEVLDIDSYYDEEDVIVDTGEIDVTDNYIGDSDGQITDEDIAVLDISSNNVDEKEIVDGGVQATDDDSVNVTNYNYSDYIAGTNIRKPHVRGHYETDEEYISYLRDYYDGYFPPSSDSYPTTNTTYRLRRDEIIQDLPIYSTQESRFHGIMTNEEIENSRNKIR